MRPSTRLYTLSTLALLSLATAACGSDDDDSSSASTAAAETTVASTAPAAAETTAPETTAPETSGAAESVDVEAYCAAEAELEQTAARLGDPSEDPVGFANTLLEGARDVREIAPPELTETFDTAIAALETVAESGTPEGLDAIDLSTAHEFDVANCGWTTTAVSMQDHTYVGLPASLAAGTYNFEAVNEGTEPHLLVIVKKKSGVTASYEELLADPAGEEMVDTVGSMFSPPGGNSYSVVTLEAGEYLAMCPIAQGTSMGAEGTGPPHFVLGMQQVITVE